MKSERLITKGKNLKAQRILEREEESKDLDIPKFVIEYSQTHPDDEIVPKHINQRTNRYLDSQQEAYH